jgi:hypothetical protein
MRINQTVFENLDLAGETFVVTRTFNDAARRRFRGRAEISAATTAVPRWAMAIMLM